MTNLSNFEFRFLHHRRASVLNVAEVSRMKIEYFWENVAENLQMGVEYC